ncbi:methylated-DNA--[protein]-cysteine S-methyltransferase [Gracilibacillus alcaliphilus]|uniref:methylated-DNA--[protein]-cysteine S-methyltransferase n=1 Tax=Gracilibacillus alcaliphilus TaxID=1401441 RepID=UPI00195E6A8F|nr:methylated-DNA--[protein]-cysteine S-methyltransferase [Gracilibacillus alcaliphilus]MBM7675329.1 O-6-methylguanine DNA methyltransferase [Gracilibacillus alcaliphilus]
MKNEQYQSVYYGKVNQQDWSFYIAVTDKGLCFVGSPNKSINEIKNWLNKNRPDTILIKNEEKTGQYVQQMKEYLHGQRTVFDLPIDLNGTPFQESVWRELQHIPYGEVISYTDIADKIGHPKAVRAVGAANGANPVMIVVPCHRVVSKSGKLTGFRGGLEMKKTLLTLENSKKIGG